MRLITEKIYKFNELSQEVKDQLIKDYNEDDRTYINRNDMFRDFAYNRLKEQLYDSEFELHYQLCYCRSDYFTINGDIAISDLIELVKDDLNDKELRTLKFYDNYLGNFQVVNNEKYISSALFNDFEYELEYTKLKNLNKELLEKFSELAYEKLSDILDELQKDGYAEIYCEDEEEAINYYEMNDYEFYENGEVYYG